MENIKVILLFNNRIAFPAMRELVFYNQVAAVIIPAANKEVYLTAKELLQGSGVELIAVTKRDFEKHINKTAVAYKPTAAIMMTFPYIIPSKLLNLFPKGFINFHYGKLPKYRGPEPIFAQISNSEKEPGLSVHIVTEGIDNGPVILQDTVPFNEDDTYGMLQNKLAQSGAKLINVLTKILSFGNFLPSLPQDESKANYYKKPVVADLMINWQTMNSTAIKALVNACNPWNKGCGTMLNGQVIGITEVEIVNQSHTDSLPGTVTEASFEKGLLVATCDNRLLKINIIYTDDGFLSAGKLTLYGVIKGNILM